MGEDRYNRIRKLQIIIEAIVKDTSELRWWLLGFGENVKVLAPEDLRKESGRNARSLATKSESVN